MKKQYTTPKPVRTISPIKDIITNNHWREIFNRFFKWQHPEQHKKEYYEAIGVMYAFDPREEWLMSNNTYLISNEKAAAIYKWYNSGDRKDRSIEDKFDEYKNLIDENHKEFNSNYGYYFYKQKQLDLCLQRLAKNKDTRQACICINNKLAMSDNSIDKLCTNNIQFFIRRGFLKMIVQMRSSNFLTLLPYDIFMFSVLYWQAFHILRDKYKIDVNYTSITVFVNSLHFYQEQFDKLAKMKPENNNFNIEMSYDSYNIYEFENHLFNN